LGPADAALLALLHEEIFSAPWDRPWSAGSFADILALPGAGGFIATPSAADGAEPEPVGFGLILSSGEEAELLLMGVRPAWRRQGVARRLLAALIHRAVGLGARRMLLEVSTANPAAIACYHAAGFVTCGRRKDYYAPGNDALILEVFPQPDNISG